MASNVEDVFSKMKKSHGATIVTQGSEVQDYSRIQTGVFPLDLATGGGFPEGKMSMVYGPESVGKTNLALLTTANYQRMFPKRVCVWIDAEHSFNPSWAAKLGVNIDTLMVGKPEIAEQAVEMAEGLIYADNMGLLVMDSVAAMVPNSVIEGDVERVQVGGNAMIMTKFCQKVFSGLIAQAKLDKYPTVLLINQIRMKIGQMFGNPENYPGGHALKHYLNMVVRVYGKDIMMKEVSDSIPAVKETTFAIKKHKCPIVSATGSYTMNMLPLGAKPVGTVDSWNTIVAYAKDHGYLVKDEKAKGWNFSGEIYKTQVDVVEMLKANPSVLDSLKETLIAEAVLKANAA